MDTPAFFLICCLMGMSKAMQEFVADESTLVDIVLEDFPIQECDSIIVSSSPIQNVGRTTVFFNHISELIAYMEDKEAFVNTLTKMECLILGCIATMKSLFSLIESEIAIESACLNAQCICKITFCDFPAESPLGGQG